MLLQQNQKRATPGAGRRGAALLREALEAFRETLGDRHSDTLTLINSLGLLLHNEGHLDDAEALYHARRFRGSERRSALGT